jgi:hypothetical protein
MTATDWHEVTPRDDYIDYVIVGKYLEEKCGPPPEGAKSDDYWGAADSNGVRSRAVRWWGRDDYDTSVYIDGTQYSDGRVERGITLYLGDNETVTITISAESAANLTAALQEALTRWDEIAR